MISADQWRAYNEAVAGVTERARADVEARVLAWLGEHPNADAAEARAASIRIMRERVGDWGRAASSLAADWYDAQGREAGARLDRAVTEVAYTDADIERVARYQARKYVGGDKAAFARSCGDYALDVAKRCVNVTVLKNARRDRTKGVRFARVTSGRNTCAFCLMLAGRGAVYWSRKTAGEFNHWHTHCSCKVVPGFSGDPHEVIVEGHDPAKIEARLNQVETMTGARRNTTEFSREVALRDPNWLLGGEARTVYDKPRDELLEHEKTAVDALHNGGLPFTVLNEDEDAAANIDLLFDSGELWEMKDIGDGKHSIEDQLKSARSKWRRLGIDDPVRVVVTGTKMTRNEEDAIAEIRRRSHYYDEALFIKKDGSFVRIVK